MCRYKFSILIPVGREELAKKAEYSLKMNEYDQEKIEIIFIRGSDPPSRKRNIGGSIAKGEYLIFLDDDIEVEKGYLKNVGNMISHRNVDVIGGPNLGFQNGNKVQRMIDIAFGSRLGFGKGAERFKKRNKEEAGDEDNLTSCNLCIRREVFLKESGFDESMFPGEEVELIRRLRLKGYTMVYSPEMIVFHHRRSTLKSLWKQINCYGRGRTDVWIKCGFPWRDVSYLMPMLLVVFTFSLPFTVFIFHWEWFMLLLYVAIVFLYGMAEGISRKLSLCEIFFLPVIFAAIHYSYGMGMLKGFIGHMKR